MRLEVCSNGDSLDLLTDHGAANRTKVEFRGTGDAAAVVPTRYERAVHLAVETHLEHEGKQQRMDPARRKRGEQDRTARASQAPGETPDEIWTRESNSSVWAADETGFTPSKGT